MQIKLLLVIMISMCLFSCNNNSDSATEDKDSADVPAIVDTPAGQLPISRDTTTAKVYSNDRFRNVTIQSLGQDSFRVKGKAQIFEASFGWVIEDGHNELKQGFTTSDAGAPEWGNFDFSFTAKKQRENSTLHVILFETSMKDGSRVHELPIALSF